MTYAQAIQFLYGLRLFGTKLGLENARKLAALAGHPQLGRRFIHVAGTNGKGSVCAMLESIYRAAGLRVGLFTSPHLVAFGERIQVNRQPIDETDVARLVAELQPWLREFPADHHPTFFEVVTVMALRYFAEQNCDLVIWETGMGGRLDATNIVTPLASVITNIQLDHQQWLGQTHAEIAAEKAGIIKPGIPVITAAEEPAALAVIRAVAREHNAPLTRVTPADAQSDFAAALTCPLPGEHQRLNAALALTTVRMLEPQIPVDEDALRTGLQHVHWPGRLQLVHLDEKRRVLFDGAHNVAGVDALCRALRQYFPEAKPALVLGVLSDKDWPAICQRMAPLADRICLTPVGSLRTAAPAILLPACQQANPTARITVHASVPEALREVADEPFVLITGSLYLVGEAMERLGLSPTKPVDERGLNEWTMR